MTDPQTVLDEIAADLEKLDSLGKALYLATDELDAAEAVWDELLDAVGEDLRAEYQERERKLDPAEHTVVSVCRKQHRAEYQRLRRAKRDLERLQGLSQIRRQAVSARQSELAALRDESRVPEPQWSGRAA